MQVVTILKKDPWALGLRKQSDAHRPGLTCQGVESSSTDESSLAEGGMRG